MIARHGVSVSVKEFEQYSTFVIVMLGLFHKRFFYRNSNLMEILFHSHLDSNTVVTMKFCTWHSSGAVMACAKIVVIWWPAMELQQGAVSIEFELQAKKWLVKSAPVCDMFLYWVVIMSRI